MGAHHGGIEHLHQMRRLAHRRQGVEECFESSRSAQPPEPLPHAVPVPEFLRKSPPSDIMNHDLLELAFELGVPGLVLALACGVVLYKAAEARERLVLVALGITAMFGFPTPRLASSRKRR
jgi:hypothetical protein